MIKYLLVIFILIPLSLVTNFWIIVWLILIIIFLFLFNNFSLFYFCELSYFFGCDNLSYSLILLRIWICLLIILARAKVKKNKNYLYFFNFVIILLLLSLYITFSSLNLFIFYLFFEVRLIPTLILIIGWGYQPERLEAGVYLLFYTIFISLPILLIIFYLEKINGSLYFFLIQLNLSIEYIYVLINIVFFVKIPIFFIHLWLPKAHVEAPVSGSIILAGVILKLGGYGLLRVIILFQRFINTFNSFILIISLIGGVIVSLICLRQGDIKSLIAYSSVAHIGMVLGGIITINYWGLWGRLLIILAHGLCSSGLFCLVNLIYERSYSRRLYLNKGLLRILPSLALIWFLLLSSNIAFPPSLNLFGEIILINRLISFNILNILFLSFLSFLRAAYSLFLYSYSQHGRFYISLYNYNIGCRREYLLLILHWVPLNLLFLKMEVFVQWIYLNSLIKILICGIKDINIFILDYL